MGKNYFTPEQVEKLRKNKYVKNVSEKAITYTKEFKEIFILEYNDGKSPLQIMIDMGFDTKVLGNNRIRNISTRVRKQALRADGFKDTRADNSGRPATKDLSDVKLIKRQQDQIEFLKQQVKFLSELRKLEREAMWKESKSKKRKV